MLVWLYDITYKTGKRVVITIVGGTVLLIGVAMLVLPGPALVVIPIGLAILGLEFAWARRFLRTIREKGEDALRNTRWGRGASARPPGESGDDDA